MRYLLLLFATTVSALKFTATKSKLGGSNSATTTTTPTSFKANVNAVVSQDNNLNLQTVNDVIYLANVTLANTSYTVQLDTGSSDLWIKGATSPIPNTDQSTSTCNLTYGIGWASGHISYASVQFAGITVDKQAFVDASSVNNPAIQYGAEGILGLGFDTLSTIDSVLNNTGASSGRTLLYNLFQQNPSEPNFIAFSFQRSTQPGDDVQGSFAIGEVEPDYKAVLDSQPIPTWPLVAPKRWNVLLEAVLIGTQQVSVSTTVANAPSNRAVVLLDSGTSYTYAPKSVVDQIYGSIPGASFDTTRGQWSVPCDTEIDMALQFGGKAFPVHPLDVIPMSKQNQCYGSFVPGAVAVGAGEFDWLVGDNVLRSIYSVYDFGDYDSNNHMGAPYVKLLSIVDPNKASSEFVALRGGTAKTNITYNVANDGGSSSSTTITISADVADTLNKMGTLFPVMLAIMGLNALVVIIAIVVAIFYLCRRRRRRTGPKIALPRTPMGRLSPMPMATRNSYVAGNDEPLAKEPHTYEPVSMAITEDTIVPPSPGFRQFDGKLGDRPKSMAMLPSQSKLYQQIGSEDALFSPPKPSFAKGSRPTSVASLPVTSITSPPPEDQPFSAPPMIALEDTNDQASVHSRQSQKADQASVHSQHSRHSPTGDASSIRSRHSQVIEAPQVIEEEQQVTSADNTLVDVTPPSAEVRPRSILVNSSRTSLHVDDGSGNTPPSAATAFFSPLSQSSITPTQSPLQSAGSGPGPSSSGMARPPVPPSFRPRSHLRPNPMANADRPMSVGILPSQQFMPPSPPNPRVGSSLRPGANLQSAMRPTSAAFPSHYPQHYPQEEDITTFEPPAPPFRRMNSSNGSDRPASMA